MPWLGARGRSVCLPFIMYVCMRSSQVRAVMNGSALTPSQPPHPTPKSPHSSGEWRMRATPCHKMLQTNGPTRSHRNTHHACIICVRRIKPHFQGHARTHTHMRQRPHADRMHTACVHLTTPPHNLHHISCVHTRSARFSAQTDSIYARVHGTACTLCKCW